MSLTTGCPSGDDTGSEPAADSGDVGGDTAPDPLNEACPNEIAPQSGPDAPHGKCCYRSANSTRVDKQGDGDAVVLEYRLNYIQTTNHEKTIGSDAIRNITMGRLDREQQSVLWRFTGPRKDGKSASGKGTIEIGSGRYNCDGTYSFYSDTAAPKTATQTDPARWAPPLVPVTIDASITDPDKAQERVVPDFAKNANRGYTFTPYLNTSTYALDWELVNQGFTIESLPTDDAALNCVGSRKEDASGWTAGGTFIVYTPIDKNDSEPIADIGGQTYCQLVAFGVVLDKTSKRFSCKDSPRCMPDPKCVPSDTSKPYNATCCPWVKLPDSLCPDNDADQAKWGCHIGYEGNPDKEPTHCTADAPTDVLDPAKGATSQGQCCDPLGQDKSLPACNAYFLRNEYVAAAAEITDDPVSTSQEDCHPKN